MAALAYRNIEHAGPPRFGSHAIAVARAIQKETGIAPMDRPFTDDIERLISPEEAERRIRATIPAWQTHYTSDDYTDMTWHAPAVRFYIGRPSLKAPPGLSYPPWVMNALGGIPASIDPMTATAAKTVAATILDLMSDNAGLAAARAEFERRREEGGDLKPWCDYDPPIHFPWPEYIETARGHEWWIPASPGDRALER
jgi:aminobenzoyl-glutamate utilization protein B